MITINEKKYKELRCSRCQKFIVYQNIAAGILCYICPRCDLINEFSFKYMKSDDTVQRDYQVKPEAKK